MFETINAYVASKSYSFTVTEGDVGLEFIHPADPTGAKKPWYKVERCGEAVVCFFGDLKTGESLHVREGLFDKSAERSFKKAKKQMDLERGEKEGRARLQAEELWERWKNAPSIQSDYLEGKSLGMHEPPAVCVTGELDAQRILVVPLFDEQGVFWNYQRIYRSNEKRFHSDARTKGLSHTIEGQDDVVYIGEGYATCLAVHKVTGRRVVCAVSASNLEAVTSQVLKAYPAERVVLLADWDGGTFEKTGTNMGMLKAQVITQKYKVKAALPGRGERNVDFADVYKENKDAIDSCLKLTLDFAELAQECFKRPKDKPSSLVKDLVKECVEALKAADEPSPVLPADAVFREFKVHQGGGEPRRELCQVMVNERPYQLPLRQTPMIEIKMKNEIAILPPEHDVVQVVLKYLDGHVVKTDSGDVYLYTGKHWEALENDDFIYQIFAKVLQGKATHKKLRDLISGLKVYLPLAQRNLAVPNPFMTSFLNGTLTTYRSNGRWEILFREHRPEDWITTLIPHEFDLTLRRENPAFEQVLKNVLGGDEEAVRALAQLYGACLAPVFPRLFMLLGKAGRGKSTLLKLAVELVSTENVSSVLPSDFGNFMAESMIGKLVNYDPDIPSNFVVDDAVIKKIEDRMPFTFNRKNKKAIKALLPPIHIFGANKLPPTMERSGAHNRRWTFIHFDSFDAEKLGTYNKDIVDDVKALGMGGLINFALGGLKDILDAEGHYFMKASEKARLVQWQNDNDPVALFLSDVEAGEITGLRKVEGGRVRRSAMWKAYHAFIQEIHPNRRETLHRNKFYLDLRDKGVVEKTSPKGISCFAGYRMGTDEA